jgi:hypothetical protein
MILVHIARLGTTPGAPIGFEGSLFGGKRYAINDEDMIEFVIGSYS